MMAVRQGRIFYAFQNRTPFFKMSLLTANCITNKWQVSYITKSERQSQLARKYTLKGAEKME